MALTAHWDFSQESLDDVVAGATIAITTTTTTSCRNSSGQLQSVAAGSGAFHYDYDGTFRGLQVRHSNASNLFAGDPEELTGGFDWLLQNAVIAANATDDPYGNVNAADTMTDSAPTVDSCYIFDGVSARANDPIEVSCFVKVITLGTGNNYFFLYPSSLAGVAGAVIWDLEDPLGTPITVQADVDDYGVEQFAGGWYRFWLVTGVETDTTATVQYGFCTGTTPAGSYTQDGRKVGLWGLTCRQLSDSDPSTPWTGPYPYSAAVNQNKDSLACSDVTWYNQSGANLSYYEEWSWPWNVGPLATNERYTLHMGTADGAAKVEVAYKTTQARVTVSNNPGDDGEIVIATAPNLSGTANHLAWTVANNDLRGSFNASAVEQDTLVTWPLSDTITGLDWEWWFGGRCIMGYIKHIAFWDADLDNATLVDYSTNGAFPAVTSFPGNIAGDGGHIWPPRANDPRWTQILTDSGITQSGNFMDDVKAALIALSGASGGGLDDLWKKTKAANNVTDTSEPWLY